MSWITLDTLFFEHPKVAELPNDSAIVAWIATLLAAKRQPRQGCFSGELHYLKVVPSARRYLKLYLKIKLLDPLPEGGLAVHGWKEYQRDPAGRQAVRRADEPSQDGHVPVTDESQPSHVPVTDASQSSSSPVTGVSQLSSSSRALPALSLSRVDVDLRDVETPGVGGVGGGGTFGPPGWPDLCQLMEALTGRPYALRDPAAGLGLHAADHLRRRGVDAVMRAYRSAAERAGPSPTARQIVLGADDLLDPIPRGQREPTADELLEESKRKTRERRAKEGRS